jgi:hypothetical protein
MTVANIWFPTWRSTGSAGHDEAWAAYRLFNRRIFGALPTPFVRTLCPAILIIEHRPEPVANAVMLRLRPPFCPIVISMASDGVAPVADFSVPVGEASVCPVRVIFV